MKQFWKTFKKKFEHFWEYYKWYAIIPLAIILIILSFVNTYIKESRPFALGIALMNTSDVTDAVTAFEVTYQMERELELPVNVNYDFVHPKDMKDAALETDDTIASIQKYQTMMRNSYIDVTFTTDWVVKEYMQIPLYADLRTYFDEEFLKENEEYIYYVIKEEIEAAAEQKELAAETGEVVENYEEINWEETGEKIPVGFKVGNCSALGTFSLDSEPVMVYTIESERKEESIAFTKWILEECKKEDVD